MDTSGRERDDQDVDMDASTGDGKGKSWMKDGSRVHAVTDRYDGVSPSDAPLPLRSDPYPGADLD